MIVQSCVPSLTSIIAYHLFAHIRLWTSTTTTDQAFLFPVGILLFVCREPRAGSWPVVWLQQFSINQSLEFCCPRLYYAGFLLCLLLLPSIFVLVWTLNGLMEHSLHKITGAANSRYLQLELYAMWCGSINRLLVYMGIKSLHYIKE